MCSNFQAVLKIAGLVREQGGRALLVGGCVRDRIQGIESKDFDLEVYGLAPETLRRTVEREFPLDLVGMSFGVFKVHHYDIDIALPRLENKTGAGHRGFMIQSVPDLSYAEAAARRDFTVNAIMCDPLTDEIIDPWNGRQDIADGVLRHVSEHFCEDPLRVLRAMQFAARFNFKVAPETVKICSTLSQEELPVERLSAEWEKLLLKGAKPSAGLEFLRECNWIRYYPELEAMIGCPQNPVFHPEGDVWRHTMQVMDHAAKMRSGNSDDDLVLMLAALCHDMGKPGTTFTDENGKIVSPGHDRSGEELAKNFINRIWRRNDLPDKVVPLVACHMSPVSLVMQEATDRAYRRLAVSAGRLDLLADLAESDVCGISRSRQEIEETVALLNEFRATARRLAVIAAAPKPLILGRHLIAMGIKPGREMGVILKRAFDAQLDGEFTDIDGGLKWLLTHLGDNAVDQT